MNEQETICGLALSTRPHVYAHTHTPQSTHPPTITRTHPHTHTHTLTSSVTNIPSPLSLNVRNILPSARGKTTSTLVRDTSPVVPVSGLFYLKPFFVGNYLVKPICCRMNNCLNGRRRRRHHYRENIIHLCCDGEGSYLIHVFIFLPSSTRLAYTRARHYAERDDNFRWGGDKEKRRWDGGEMYFSSDAETYKTVGIRKRWSSATTVLYFVFPDTLSILHINMSTSMHCTG